MAVKIAFSRGSFYMIFPEDVVINPKSQKLSVKIVGNRKGILILLRELKLNHQCRDVTLRVH